MRKSMHNSIPRSATLISMFIQQATQFVNFVISCNKATLRAPTSYLILDFQVGTVYTDVKYTVGCSLFLTDNNNRYVLLTIGKRSNDSETNINMYTEMFYLVFHTGCEEN